MPDLIRKQIEEKYKSKLMGAVGYYMKGGMIILPLYLGYYLGYNLYNSKVNSFSDNQEVRQFLDAKTTLKILEERLKKEERFKFITTEIQSYQEYLKEKRESEGYSRLEDAVNSVKERINAMENSSMIKKYNSKDKFLVATIIGFMSYLFLGVFGFNFLEKKYSKEKEAELKNLDTG